MNYCAVITTINPPNKAIEEVAKRIPLIVIGDEKTPKDWEYEGVDYILDLPKDGVWYEGYAPKNHYARKNLGYLKAIESGAELIFDIDDDTIPNDNWGVRNHTTEAKEAIGEGWFNVYGALSDDYIWPRGFSLRQLRKEAFIGSEIKEVKSSIQQGLVDGDPDVDAIWRLVLKKEHSFVGITSVYLNENSWCPFNSQCTWWFPRAYALMYLPVTVSFRMTDIWRSFIAQRCLWELDEVVTYHSPSESVQIRNTHDLIDDLRLEYDGYLHNDAIVSILGNMELKKGDDFVCENLLACYQSLADAGIIKEAEIRSVMAWIKKYKSIINEKV